MINIEALKKHFRSEGFRKRWEHIYKPALRYYITWIYNYIINKYFTNTEIKKQGYAERELSNKSAYISFKPEKEYILEYEDAVEYFKKYFNIKHKPQKLGTCVAHTFANMFTAVSKLNTGGDGIKYSVQDIYMDRGTLHIGIDEGMYPGATIARIAAKGVAPDGTVPEAKTIDDLTKYTRENYPDSALAPFRDKYITGEYEEFELNGSFDELWKVAHYVLDKYGVAPFQVSILSYQNMFTSDFPVATGKVLGSHSKIMIAMPLRVNGKRALLSIDSAYAPSAQFRIEKGVRIEVEGSVDAALLRARVVKFKPELADVFKKLKLEIFGEEASDASDKVEPVNYKESGKKVEKLQRKLMSLGYDIPAISSGIANYGYYGDQTKEAVRKWKADTYKVPIDDWQAEHFLPYDCDVINKM